MPTRRRGSTERGAGRGSARSTASARRVRILERELAEQQAQIESYQERLRAPRLDYGELQRAGVTYGVKAIISDNPRWGGLENYLVSNVDGKRLTTTMRQLKERAESQGYTPDQTAEYITRELADYVSSGEAFNDAAKGRILRYGKRDVGLSAAEQGTAKKGSLWNTIMHPIDRIKSRKEISRAREKQVRYEGERYLNNTISAFGQIYEMLKAGDFAQRMPELEQAVGQVYDGGFMSAATDILKEYNLIDTRSYTALKQAIYARTKEGVAATRTIMESYAKGAAAAILGIFGFFLISVFGKGITGNAVGMSGGGAYGTIAGVLLMLAAALLFFKKNNKKK